MTSLQWITVILIGLLLGLFILFVFKLPSMWIPLILIAAIFPLVVLVTGNPEKILIALIILDIPLQLDIALRSQWILNFTGVINGYIISVTTICLAALYALWMLEYLLNKESVSQPIRRPNIFLVLYIALTCLSIVVAELKMIASFEIFLLLQMFLLYFYIINKVRSRDTLTFIVAMLLVSLILESLIIMLIQVTGQGFGFAGILGNIYARATTPDGASRIGGTLVSANAAGSYFSLLITPAFSLLMTPLKKPNKWLALTAFVCGVIGLILTGSRGAWMATFIAFVIFGLFSFRRGWLKLRIVMVGTVIAILISLLFYTPIYERIFGYDAGAAASRIPQYEVALQIIRDNPIFGVGVNNYPDVQRRYLGIGPDNLVFRWAVHNKYLLVWAETGFFGLLFFVLFLLSKIRQGFRIAHFNDALLSPLALGFATVIIGQMTHMFIDVFHARPQVQLLWLLAGLLMAMSYMREPKERSTN